MGETLKGWGDAEQLFPKDQSGGVDWVAAVRSGAIAPRRTRDGSPEEPQEAVPDFELVPEKEPQFAALFSHGVHLRWLKCVNCHPDPFPGRRAGNAEITMAKIFEGQFCGRCHGKVAFDMSTGCLRCHRKLLE
jgi:c(7)-type cytochrome triheme protein